MENWLESLRDGLTDIMVNGKSTDRQRVESAINFQRELIRLRLRRASLSHYEQHPRPPSSSAGPKDL